MMREVCFCGRHGLVIDRVPVYAGDGEWGLECPVCGNLERLPFLPPDERHERLRQAAARQIERREGPWPDQRFAQGPFLRNVPNRVPR